MSNNSQKVRESKKINAGFWQASEAVVYV